MSYAFTNSKICKANVAYSTHHSNAVNGLYNLYGDQELCDRIGFPRTPYSVIDPHVWKFIGIPTYSRIEVPPNQFCIIADSSLSVSDCLGIDKLLLELYCYYFQRAHGRSPDGDRDGLIEWYSEGEAEGSRRDAAGNGSDGGVGSDGSVDDSNSEAEEVEDVEGPTVIDLTLDELDWNAREVIDLTGDDD